MIKREINPPFYRKVSLSGRPNCDLEPNKQKRTDVEAEKTCVDALTLQLRHQTTDFYVKLVRSDFALSVRRNNFAAVWHEHGLTAARQPDLPFGSCWRSGLAANVHVIDRGENEPVEVLVTDEQGMLHSLVELFREGRPVGYYPLPNIESEQDDRAMTMVRRGDFLELRRKFGTTLSFHAREPAVEMQCTSTAGVREIHRYFRLDRATHHRGGYIQFHFDALNRSLIPDEMTFVKTRFRIQRNERGLIERIIGPRGTPHDYEYRPPRISGGAPVLIAQGKFTTGALGGCTYDCEEREGSDGWRYADLSRIADGLGNTFTFRHGLGDQASSPLRLSEVEMPDGAISRFYSYAKWRGGEAESRATVVKDAEGNGILYEFSRPQVATLAGLPSQRGATGPGSGVTLSGWLRMDVSYLRGNGHRYDAQQGKVRFGILTRRLLHEAYEFDAGAGLALARAFDGEGNMTSFKYADPLFRSELRAVLPDGFIDPFAERCRDATEIVNPLGGVRCITYHPTNCVLVRRVDELGHVTVWDVDDATGMDFAMTTYASEEDERKDKPFSRTEWQFKNKDFPAFVTRKVHRKLSGESESPAWEVDLVRTYEADESGNLVREIADPDGRKMVWNYRYDEENNRLSTHFPDDYFAQFRYDPYNRLVRLYRAHPGVKKQAFNARGDLIREWDTNGEQTIIEYDKLSRVKRRVEEKKSGSGLAKTESRFRYNAVNSIRRELVTGQPDKIRSFDALQRVVVIREPLKRPAHYSYRVNGCSNLFRKSKYCPASFYSGDFLKRQHFAYDGLQNKISETVAAFRWLLRFAQPRVVCLYDKAGNLVEKRSGTTITRHEYDPHHQLVMTREDAFWRRTLRTSTGLEYGTVDSTGVRTEKKFDSGGYEVTS